MNLTLGMIGLGRMGGNMSRRIARAGHVVVAWDRAAEARAVLAGEPRLVAVVTLEELVANLPSPRIVWLMLPAGAPTDETLLRLVPLLSPGDVVVDGANAMYRDSQRHAAALAERELLFVDAGVSGGVWGLENGYGLMVGGEVAAVRTIEPVLRALAPAEDRGWVHCGPAGAGHFTKMVHNGIEYGMMQAYGEGFSLLNASPYGSSLDFSKVAHLWNQGSVVRSWLLELLETAFAKDPRLSEITGYVEDSGEGRWTVQQAIETGVPIPVIALSLFQRFRSREKDAFSDKVLAALRKEFGGHAVVAAGSGRKE